MALKKYTSLIDAMTKLQRRGFNRTFTLKGDRLHCLQTQKFYKRHEVVINEFHRFQSDKLNLNRAVIFAVTCRDGEKGYIVSFKKVNEMMNLLKFMDKVKIQNHGFHNDLEKESLQKSEFAK